MAGDFVLHEDSEEMKQAQGWAFNDFDEMLLTGCSTDMAPDDQHSDDEAGPDEPQPSRATDWARFNSKMQNKSVTFVQKAPLAKVVLARMILQPAIRMMSAALGICGKEWLQQARADLLTDGPSLCRRPI